MPGTVQALALSKEQRKVLAFGEPRLMENPRKKSTRLDRAKGLGQGESRSETLSSSERPGDLLNRLQATSFSATI